MLVISHRGNINGANKSTENNPGHISQLLNFNVPVEIDVWYINGQLLLGHDKPEYKIFFEFITHKNLWCHAKNLNALEYMLEANITNCFWHQTDDYTLTSSSYIWTFPNKLITKKSIIVDLTNNWKDKNYQCHGVCVDYL